jgi:hypothetical protein
LTHMLDLKSGDSALLLASPAPGPLQPLAAALGQGLGDAFSHVCASEIEFEQPTLPFAAMLTSHAVAACEFRAADPSQGELAADAAAVARAAGGSNGALPSLSILRSTAFGNGTSRVVVALEAAGATRWALAFSPDRVVRYALAQRSAADGGEYSNTLLDEPRVCSNWSNEETVGKGCSPLHWTPVMPPHPRLTVPWQVLRHAGGHVSGRSFLVWLDVKDSKPYGESGALLRMRADYHAGTGGAEGTQLWRLAKKALPSAASVFGKASLPQALALFAELDAE